MKPTVTGQSQEGIMCSDTGLSKHTCSVAKPFGLDSKHIPTVFCSFDFIDSFSWRQTFHQTCFQSQNQNKTEFHSVTHRQTDNTRSWNLSSPSHRQFMTVKQALEEKKPWRCFCLDVNEGKNHSGKNRLQWKLKLKLHQPQSSFLKVTNFSEEKPLVKRSAFCFSDSTFLRTKGWSFFTVGSMLKKFLTK